ncbi:glycogen phosphorylase [Klebsiella pneumoniae]|nr:glycogen phosphorylase [Klebsiella pneumoniae]
MNVPFSYASPTLSVEALKHSIAYKLMFIIGKDPAIANKHEWLNATLFAVRDRMVERWLRSNRAQLSQEVRQVYYLSMEFLIGRTLSNALLSLGIYDDVSSALAEMGLDLEELIDEENDPGLGNGGLGRLAACFLDSLAALGLPGRGYGIRYDYGMFKQNIVSEINRVSVVAPGRIIRCCISHPVARSKSRPGRSLLIQLRVYKRRVRRNVQGQANSRY